jgi:two-component sensor histidine kinase
MTTSLSREPSYIDAWTMPRVASGGRPDWRRDLARQVVVVLACIGAAIGLRGLLGLAAADIVPYATLFPAVVIAALFGGGWAGLATLLLGWIVAWYVFLGPLGFTTLSTTELVGAILYALSAGIVLLITVWLRRVLVRLEQVSALREVVVESSAGIVVPLSGDTDWREPQSKWELLTAMHWPAYRGAGWLTAVHDGERALLMGLLQARAGAQASTEVRLRTPRGWRWFTANVAPIVGARAPFPDRVLIFTDVHEQKLARERQDLLAGELRHRLKNLVGIIQALLSSSLPRNDAAAAAIAEKFMARLRAIEVAGDLVMAANWRDVEMSAIVERVLAPFKESYKSRISYAGPTLLLHEHTAGGIALACHELATNAVKYGALAGEGGDVSVDWSIEPQGENETVIWQWKETHSRTVTLPETEGFGLRVIRSAVAREQDTKVDIQFLPGGLLCRLKFLRPREGQVATESQAY